MRIKNIKRERCIPMTLSNKFDRINVQITNTSLIRFTFEFAVFIVAEDHTKNKTVVSSVVHKKAVF